jgi:alpha-tubulin suppressor-like RCC1 family protein
LANGTAVCWGANNNSQLHTDPAQALQVPTPLIGASNIKQISVGKAHTCILNEQKIILCKGHNFYGELGDDDDTEQPSNSNTFVAVRNLPGVPKQVIAGEDVTVALLEDSSVACWGQTSRCQGADDGGPNLSATLRPTKIPGVGAVKAVEMSTAVSCAVGINGRSICWGSNYLGQLGRGSRSDDALGPGDVLGLDSLLQISTSDRHVCAVGGDRTLYCWGSNSFGELGSPCGATLPCQVAPNNGSSYVAAPAKVSLPNVAEVRVGDFAANAFACARTTDGKVYCWGSNAKGQLGNGTKGGGEPTPKPIVWR